MGLPATRPGKQAPDARTRVLKLHNDPPGDASSLRAHYEFNPPQRTLPLDNPTRYADAAAKVMADQSSATTRAC